MQLKLVINNGTLFRDNCVYAVILCWILISTTPVIASRTRDYWNRFPIPSFNSSSGNVTFYLGGTANLSCVVNNLGARTVTWRKLPDETPITVGERKFFKEDKRISISHDSSRNNWDLIIKDLEFEDAGVYECQVPSVNKKIRQHIFLRVKEAPYDERTDPPPVIAIFAPNLTHVGDRLTIKCSATYTGVASIDWFFDGYLLESNTDEGIQIKERFSSVSKTVHSTLEITAAEMKNSGIYTCRSADKYVEERRVTVLSDVRTNNKKRDKLHKESTPSSQISNVSTATHPDIFLIVTLLAVSYFYLMHNKTVF